MILKNYKASHHVPQIFQKTKTIPLNKKSSPSIRPPDLSTFTTNLSKKIHAKNLKIFFKKIFLKKKLVFGVRKKGFFGGQIPRKKCLDHKKKRQLSRLPVTEW